MVTRWHETDWDQLQFAEDQGGRRSVETPRAEDRNHANKEDVASPFASLSFSLFRLSHIFVPNMKSTPRRSARLAKKHEGDVVDLTSPSPPNKSKAEKKLEAIKRARQWHDNRKAVGKKGGEEVPNNKEPKKKPYRPKKTKKEPHQSVKRDEAVEDLRQNMEKLESSLYPSHVSSSDEGSLYEEEDGGSVSDEDEYDWKKVRRNPASSSRRQGVTSRRLHSVLQTDQKLLKGRLLLLPTLVAVTLRRQSHLHRLL